MDKKILNVEVMKRIARALFHFYVRGFLNIEEVWYAALVDVKYMV